MSDKYILRKEITVEAPREKAFRVFTEGFDRWWPRTHHIGKAEMQQATIEPKLGGRWYEKCVDGSECEWGTVLAWEPPARLVLSWQLTHNYQYDPNFITEVEVTFEERGPNRTHVVLQHKNLDRYGDKMEDVKSNIGNEDGGWGGLMKMFAAETER